MFKFFREIRQNLLIENKTGKYLKYAIGEIVLVVIGILIALGINNLREKSNNLKSECFYLTNLLDNLNEDKKEILFILKEQEKHNSGKNTFLQLLESNEIDKQVLSSAYQEMAEYSLTFFANPSAFNSLKSSGNLSLIQNKVLQLKLSNLYEKVYYRIDYNGQLYDQRMETNAQKLVPFINFSTLEFTNLDIIKNSQLKNILAFEQDYSIFYNRLLENAINKINELQVIIANELKRCD